MRNVLIVIVALIAGVLIGGGIIYVARNKNHRVVSPPDQNASTAKETPDASAIREQEFQKRLSERDDAINQLREQVALLQRQLAEMKENREAHSASKESEPKDKSSQSKENMRRYAKAILAMYGKDDALRNDPALQNTFQELTADMMKLMARHNINFNMWGGDEELYKGYAVPEIRQWFCELGAAMFEELGQPLTEAQLKAVDEAMAQTAEEGKKLDEPTLSRLEKAILFQKFKSERSRIFAGIFTDEQNQKLPDIASNMIGGNPYRSEISSRIDDKSRSREECSNAVMQRWANELKLNEGEKQNIRYFSDMYVNEYAALKAGVEAEYGREFVDYYLQRYDRSNKELQQNWWRQRYEYFKTPENKSRQESANLRFAELQLKYQKQLQDALPDRQEQIKTQRPQITHFPYLGE
ncbi:MAG: hypothetical protein AB1599_09030 [Planctomycetota bacterium]